MQSTPGSRFRRLTSAVLAVAVMGIASSCSTESGGQATSASSDDEVAQKATEAIEKLYGDGTFTEPVSTGPKAQPGYKVALVSSGVQSPTGTAMANGAKAAAELLGWDLSVYDGKYEPSEYQEGIRQAISQDADAIWLYSIDCPLVKTALEEAKAASIPVFSQEAADCSDVDPS